MLYMLGFTKRLVVILCCLLIWQFSSGQEKRIYPYFEFTQIDSLVNDVTAKIIKADSSAMVVGSVVWYIGSTTLPKDKKIGAYRNGFEINVLFSKKHKCYLQRIDNFGYYKPEKIKGTEALDFLNKNMNEMMLEKLDYKVDTIYNAVGSLTTSYTVIDHELSETIYATLGTQKLYFKFLDSYSKNKYNLLTRQYTFLQLIRDIQTMYEKREHHRRIHFLYKTS
jgi:hypothetical protein